MTTVQIRHQTRYHYHQPVTLGPQRLMLRPRESHDVQLDQFTLTVTPTANIRWAEDVFGNAIAMASFDQPTDSLTIESQSTVRLDAQPWPIFAIAASAISYPFFTA